MKTCLLTVQGCRLTLFLLLMGLGSQAQIRYKNEAVHFNPAYHRLTSGSALQDKCYYLLTLLESIPSVSKQLTGDTGLQSILRNSLDRIGQSIPHCADRASCYLNAWHWTAEERAYIEKALLILVGKDKATDVLMRHIRACGDFIQYDSLDDAGALREIWKETAHGLEYCVNAYLGNQGLLYPGIDSSHYPVSGHYYGDLVREIAIIVGRRQSHMHFFFEPYMGLASELLLANGRDEAVRYDLPRLNGAAAHTIPMIDWKRFMYSAILVLGEGPEDETVPLSPHGKYRCELAVNAYRAGLAPLIIVSGGHVHPFQTPFSEAIEMKKWLMQHWKIPESAILVDPVARHTTTNFRNSARFIYQYKIPATKKMLAISGQSAVDYICSSKFKDRCVRDLHYLVFRELQRLDEFSLSYYPVEACLQINPMEPLDP